MYVLYAQGILFYKDLEVGTDPSPILNHPHLKLSEGLNEVQNGQLIVGLTRTNLDQSAVSSVEHSPKFVHRFNGDQSFHQQPVQ